MTTRKYRERLIAALAAFSVTAVVSAQAPPLGRKQALLIAPTDYPFAPSGAISSLWGPPQDARIFSEMLQSEFGFERENIRILTSPLDGWESTPADDRPTRANIECEFKRLIDESASGDQIVILMSMHGTQQNLDPNNPDRSEADGKDEVLLPADATKITAGDAGIPNGIVDNELRVWLQAIAAKGAHVWIIFDACCSGGAWRGAGNTERYRFVRPENLGVTPDAHPPAAPTVARARGAEDTAAEAADIDAGTKGIVAFYAARSDLNAPESPLAAADPNHPRREEFHGWLTWSICQVLTSRHSALSYRELAQQVLGRYRVRLPPESPFPYGEGDLDREVLGEKRWQERSRIVVREVTDEHVVLTAGSLAGLTAGSILAVYPKMGDLRPQEVPLGYVEIMETGPSTAKARAVEFDAHQAVQPADLLDGRCEVARYDCGDARIAIAIQTVRDPAGGGDRSRSAAAIETHAPDQLPVLIAAALEQLPTARRALFNVTSAPGTARLLLRIEADRVRLMPAVGEFVAAFGAIDDRSRGQFFSLERPDAAALADRLSAAIAQIYKWHNLLAVAQQPAVSAAALGLRMEVARVVGGERFVVDPQQPFLEVGDKLEITLHNTGSAPLDVTLLVLDEGFGITPFFPDPQRADECLIRPGESRVFADVTVGEETLGRESLLAIAVPTVANGACQEFTWLAQQSLCDAVKGFSERGRGNAADTPFAKLLASGAFDDVDPAARTRSLKIGPTPAAQMAVISWETRRPPSEPRP